MLTEYPPIKVIIQSIPNTSEIVVLPKMNCKILIKSSIINPKAMAIFKDKIINTAHDDSYQSQSIY